MVNKEKILLGSRTAKDGFKNEGEVVSKFNNWKKDKTAQKWLEAMSYDLKKIKSVDALKVKGSYKADIQVQIKISFKAKETIDCQNLQVKLVSNPIGFNQIDKRWIEKYRELWKIDKKTIKALKHFTGELLPYTKDTKDKRRMNAHELTEKDLKAILTFFNKNKMLILTDIIKGRGKYSAEWMLVILKVKGKKARWGLKPINFVLNLYDGEVIISPKGSFRIGKVGVQRKGGDGGRPTAKMLQFKINPALLVDS